MMILQLLQVCHNEVEALIVREKHGLEAEGVEDR
jgi:hypothetical protein